MWFLFVHGSIRRESEREQRAATTGKRVGLMIFLVFVVVLRRFSFFRLPLLFRCTSSAAAFLSIRANRVETAVLIYSRSRMISWLPFLFLPLWSGFLLISSSFPPLVLLVVDRKSVV